MITVKDFAREQGCGESIVYRHIRNHRQELGERIQKVHGRTWITPEGSAFIKSLMTQQMVLEEKAAPEVKSLQKQIHEQEVTIKMQENIIEALKMKFEDLQAEKLRLTEGMEQQVARLEADNEVAKGKIAAAEKIAQDAQQALTDAHEAFEEDLGKKDSRIQELEECLQAEKARKLTFLERLTGRKKPVAPPIEQEVEPEVKQEG